MNMAVMQQRLEAVTATKVHGAHATAAHLNTAQDPG